MARKIIITLRKGGSGKTTTAINLATALMQKGKKTLLIDLDPQANATIGVGIDPTTLPRHINTLFTDKKIQPKDVITKTSFGLDIIPSHPDLADTEAGMNATSIGTLKAIVDPLDDLYEFIVIDTPPSESYLSVNALVAGDEVLITLQAHFLAMRGLGDQVNEINHVRQGLNPGLKIVGILPTMVSQRTNISKMILDQVKDAYKELLLPIAVDFSIKHTEASLMGMPIILYDPQHPGSKSYIELANFIIRKDRKNG